MTRKPFDARHVTAVSAVLKERFNNLTVAETLRLATGILDSLNEAEDQGDLIEEISAADVSRFLVANRTRATEIVTDNALTIAEVQARNVERANRWHDGDFRGWSGLEWAGAMCGEAGEAANVAKKLRRVELHLDGNAWSERKLDRDQLVIALAGECADTHMYLSLLAARYGINLASAVREKFNAKSVEMGFPERL